MNIAILGTRGIPAAYGGFETFAEQLGSRLVERGHHVTVFCECAANPSPEYRGIRLEYVPASAPGPMRTILYDVRSLWRARHGFDVVYMLGYGASAFCCIPRFWGSQVWINMDGLEWSRAKWGRLARLYLHASEALATLTPDRIIADALAIKQSLQSRYRRLPPCDVIPYGCELIDEVPNPALLRDFALEPKSYYLVVCRFEPENHVLEIIEGFVSSRSPFKLVLVGDISKSSNYVSKLMKAADPRVHLVGTVYDNAKLSALRYHSLAYLHGHSVGGTNPSLLEAMGCSSLVIAHENRFSREVLGTSGLFFRDAQQLAEHIDELEADGFNAAYLSGEAKKRAAQFYNWHRIAEAYSELLAAAAHQRSGATHPEVDYSPGVSGVYTATRPHGISHAHSETPDKTRIAEHWT